MSNVKDDIVESSIKDMPSLFIPFNTNFAKNRKRKLHSTVYGMTFANIYISLLWRAAVCINHISMAAGIIVVIFFFCFLG